MLVSDKAVPNPDDLPVPLHEDNISKHSEYPMPEGISSLMKNSNDSLGICFIF